MMMMPMILPNVFQKRCISMPILHTIFLLHWNAHEYYISWASPWKYCFISILDRLCLTYTNKDLEHESEQNMKMKPPSSWLQKPLQWYVKDALFLYELAFGICIVLCNKYIYVYISEVFWSSCEQKTVYRTC